MSSDPAKTRLAAVLRKCAKNWLPPEELTVDEWADKYRFLDSAASAEPGLWRTSRVPYMREIMRAFTEPKVSEIAVVAPSQVSKTELLLNVVLFIIDQDPGTILYVMPTKESAEEFSELRLKPAMLACKRLRGKVRGMKEAGKNANSHKLRKKFPGGMLFLAGSNSPTSLSSKPARYVIADELDRFSFSAGRDGDPWELAKRRQVTFYNAKRVAVSTPTVKGASQIEFLYNRGTQERWQTRCPRCGEYHEIRFDDIRFKSRQVEVAGRKTWNVHIDGWRCPGCGEIISEEEAKGAEGRWEATDAEALKRTHTRSFWLTGFVSPWRGWREIVREFLEVKEFPDRLKVWKNTTVGELWEPRTVHMTEKELMARAEKYPESADLPGEAGMTGPLVLTCGVDCQHTYLQYEIVGWGRYGESWGVKSGYIRGKPDDDETWAQLDDIIGRVYRFENGRGLRVALTLVDSGDGRYTNDIALRTSQRMSKRVFACKGVGRPDFPFITAGKLIPFGRDKTKKYWLYNIGVNAGKTAIMDSVEVETPGAHYMHLPEGEERGYDLKWYIGLLSETAVSHGGVVRWEVLPGHDRNEALDCRNYALAAVHILEPNFDAIAKALLSDPAEKKTRKKTAMKPMRAGAGRRSRIASEFD